MRHSRIRFAFIAAGITVAASANAQLFKCVTPQGKTVYQDSACEDTAKQSTVRTPTPGAPTPSAAPKEPAKAGAGAPTPAAAAPASGTVETVALYTVCTERVPNFLRKNADAFEGWKMRNSGAMDSLSSEPNASRLDARLREERERPQEGLPERCADIATTIQVPRETGTPVSTPVK